MPPPISTAEYVDAGVVVTPSPTYGGTVKPTVNVFGSGLGSAGAKTHLNHHQQQQHNLHLQESDNPVDATAEYGVGAGAGSLGSLGEGEGDEREGWEAPTDSFVLLNELMKKRAKTHPQP